MRWTDEKNALDVLRRRWIDENSVLEVLGTLWIEPPRRRWIDENSTLELLGTRWIDENSILEHAPLQPGQQPLSQTPPRPHFLMILSIIY